MVKSLPVLGAFALCVSSAGAFSPGVFPARAVAPRQQQAQQQQQQPRSQWVASPLSMATEDAEVKAVPATKPASSSSSSSSSSSDTAIVPINKENIEFGVGVVGGVAGFVTGGPVLAALLAVLVNYGSRQEGEVGDAVRGVGKSAIETFNFFMGVNTKYSVTEKTSKALSEAVDKLKAGESAEAVEKVENVIKGATSQASKITAEYDLLAKGKQALGVVGEFTDQAIEKGLELEKEYKLTDQATAKAKEAYEELKKTTKK